MPSAPFDYEAHARYFGSCLSSLPEPYSKLDTNRLTLVHFAVHALDLLNVWDDMDNESGEVTEGVKIAKRLIVSKQRIIDWIYSLQVSTLSNCDPYGGFMGGHFLGDAETGSHTNDPSSNRHFSLVQGHIAMTYTALASLCALGDDFTRVDKSAIVRSLKALQLENGSYRCTVHDSEHDMRFLYCACCISHMLNDWSGVNLDTAADYIRSCRSWDGAIALLPGQEGHGGSTFCAVASLVLMQKLESVIDDEWHRELVQWCVRRQLGGMQGRPNKDEDTCYSYWIGGTLRLLGQDDLLDHERLRNFVMRCQTQVGGFSKMVGIFPDVLHSFYSLAYLSISQTWLEEEETQLGKVDCTLGIREERAARFEPRVP